MILEQREDDRILDPERVELKQQALAEVARSDAGRIELLNPREGGLDDLQGDAALARYFRERAPEVAGFVGGGRRAG